MSTLTTLLLAAGALYVLGSAFTARFDAPEGNPSPETDDNTQTNDQP